MIEPDKILTSKCLLQAGVVQNCRPDGEFMRRDGWPLSRPSDRKVDVSDRFDIVAVIVVVIIDNYDSLKTLHPSYYLNVKGMVEVGRRK